MLADIAPIGLATAAHAGAPRRSRPFPAIVRLSAIGFAFIASAIFLLLYAMRRHLLYVLTMEDGWLEWAQAIAFLLSAAGFALLAIRRARSRLLCAGLALMCFFVAGEEISWGQRLFKYGTPPLLRRGNEQHEFNFHNLRGVNGSHRLIGLAITFGLSLVIPLAYHYLPRVRGWLRRIEAPVFPLWSNVLFGAAFLWMFIPRAFLDLPPLGRPSTDEIGELLIAIGYLASTAWLVLTPTASTRMGEVEPPG
jgi:hypothetical protein